MPVSSVSRDSELSTCTAVYFLVVCSYTFYAWKWTTAVILSSWAHCLLRGWLERLAFLHLPLQQESCFYLSVHHTPRHHNTQVPDSDDYFSFSPFCFPVEDSARGWGWFSFSSRSSKELLLAQGNRASFMSLFIGAYYSLPKKEAKE